MTKSDRVLPLIVCTHTHTTRYRVLTFSADVECRTAVRGRFDDVEYVGGLLRLDPLEYATDGGLLSLGVGRGVRRYVVEQVGRGRRVFEVLVDGRPQLGRLPVHGVPPRRPLPSEKRIVRPRDRVRGGFRNVGCRAARHTRGGAVVPVPRNEF